jgi:hypothetical protein
VEVFYVEGDETSWPMKRRKFIDRLRDYQHLKGARYMELPVTVVELLVIILLNLLSEKVAWFR